MKIKEFDEASKKLLDWVDENKNDRSILVIATTTEEDGKLSRSVAGKGKPASLGRAIYRLMMRNENFSKAILAAVNLYIDSQDQEEDEME